MVGTLTIETLDVEAMALEQGPLYLKESRDKMTGDKHNDLFKEAMKLSQACYDFTSMNMTDERCLDNLYNMSTMIAKTKASHQQYDMCYMFTVVFPLTEGSRTLEDKHLDLYTQYDKITEEEVAASCEWYNKWMAKEYYCDTLMLTNRSLPLWTLLAVLWQMCHIWITYGTVRISTITMRKVIWRIGSSIACIACLYKPHDSLATIGSSIGALVGLL